MQDKLQNLAGQHSDVLETLSPNVRKRVEFLREIQVCVFSNIIKFISFFLWSVSDQFYSIFGCFVYFISFTV